MAETGYVRMLRESLEKKVGVLMQIQEMNRRQKDILENAISTPEELDENIAKKQELIDRLDQLDSGFQQMYERVRDLFRANPEEYKDEILKMKDLIREITDLSTRIQVEEKENKSLLEAKFSDIRHQAKEIRKNQKAVSSYYQSMARTNLVDPQFMDDKK